MGTPSPPPGASPPPRSPPPPRAPPPLAGDHGILRLGAAERPSDGDCSPVSYEECRRAAVEVGTALGLSTNLDISLASCEKGTSTTPCHVGCTLGASSGAPSLYVFLTEEQIARSGNYNSYRCAAAAHEYCLCAKPPVWRSARPLNRHSPHPFN